MPSLGHPRSERSRVSLSCPLITPERRSSSEPRGRFARPLRACLLVVSLAGAAQAGPLADPTRPPAGAGTSAGSADTSPVRARDGRATVPAARPAAVVAPLPVLQSVRVPATGPATAMIDGQSVRAGDTVGGRLVQAVDRLGITLAGRPAPERVLLLGGSTKQPPGSIATSHATRYEPATADNADTPQRADRPGLAMPSANASPNASPNAFPTVSPNTPTPPPPTTPAPLSVAGRTAP